LFCVFVFYESRGGDGFFPGKKNFGGETFTPLSSRFSRKKGNAMQRASERIRRYRRKTKGCIAPNAFRAIRFAGEKNEDQRTPFERRLKKKRRCHAEREIANRGKIYMFDTREILKNAHFP